MRYGISAAAIILRDGQLLLVHHRVPGRFDYWLPPGGGLEGEESILDCLRREAFEETGLHITPGQLLYVQEFVEPGYHFVKFFFLCKSARGELTLANRVEGEDWLVDVRFFWREELQALKVYPDILKDQFWADLAAGALRTRYLGLEHIPP
jgi:8-oxo-dGTP diphosphatase